MRAELSRNWNVPETFFCKPFLFINEVVALGQTFVVLWPIPTIV
ncbi:MAG TPA: hypothetical protein VJ869_00720 [Sphaerochaeta sp.]|nr:hypothetical protein [Sphaerochaeta sp.]